jgi:hypothetical protein
MTVYLMAVQFIPASQAGQLIATNAYHLASEKIEEDELWIIAGTIELAGTASNDISAAAGGMVLSGDFHQSVVAVASSNLTFTGRARQILRLAGRYISFNGMAEDSVAAAALTVSVGASNRFDQTTVLIGDTVVTDGVAEGDMWVFANSATIQGKIRGTLHARAHDIVVVPGTEIGGDFRYAAPRDIVLSNRVRVDGEIHRMTQTRLGLSYVNFLILHLLLLGGALIVGMPFVRLFPRTIVHTTSVLARAPARCALTGMGIGVCIPVAALLFLIFPITLPLSLVLWMSLALMAYFAQIAVALTVGGIILRQIGPSPNPPRALNALMLGLVILYLATAIPVVNAVLWIVILASGMGSLGLGMWASQQLIPAPLYPDQHGGANDSNGPGNAPPHVDDHP